MDTNRRRSSHNTGLDYPLFNQQTGRLEADVTSFHRIAQLTDVVDLPTLIRGAKLSRQRWNKNTAGLTEAEEIIVGREMREISIPWLQNRSLLVTIMTTACAAITQGWQQSTINSSSLLNWEEDLGLNHDQHQLLIGLINAAPWLSGSLIGTWLSDPLQDHFGRRPALFVAAIFCVVLVIGTAHCRTWETLLVCRILLGVGIGSKASIAPIFAAEAAPDQHRGQVLMLWQLFDALGIFLGFVSVLIVMDSWRVLLATATIPAIVLLFLVFICPESPRYLIQKNKYADAYQSLLELRGTPVQAARDLYYIHSQLQTEAITKWDPPQTSEESFSWQRGDGYAYQQWIKKGNFFKRMRYLATDDRTRRACIVALIVMASQQLCGINVLTFYSSSLFNKGAFLNSSTVIKWYNFSFGLANFLFTLPVLGFIDSRGRRPLLLVSFTGMLFSLLAISGFFKIANESTKGILIGVFSIVFFLFFYSIGAGPIPFTLSAEVFPLCVRGKLMNPSICHQLRLIHARGWNEFQRYDQLPWPWDLGSFCSSVNVGIQGPGKPFVSLLVRFEFLSIFQFAALLTA
ncbi:unnamed protein product [Penicillium salamii]|uniref:Major facilitator superfamily (MFS) profile domain-containing protein n=1 Tax=Penicillium salamii TaxID=1612424 RepID=A0A9W4JPI1_9EURO|nr:unnamed protein product [Penicillium salamii]